MSCPVPPCSEVGYHIIGSSSACALRQDHTLINRLIDYIYKIKNEEDTKKNRYWKERK
jgi:hypothetical protein